MSDSDLFKQLNAVTSSLNKDYKNAANQYEILCDEIKEFQDSLDNEHEVGLITFSNTSKPFIVTNLGFHNPSLIYFYGYIDDNEAQLIQHINQITLLLVAVPKLSDKPLRRIEFATDTD